MNSLISLVLLGIGICIPMVVCDWDKFDRKRDFAFKDFHGKRKDGHPGKHFFKYDGKHGNGIKDFYDGKAFYDGGNKFAPHYDGNKHFGDGYKFRRHHGGKKSFNHGNKYIKDGYGNGYDGRKYGPKIECSHDKQCNYKEVCSGGFCNPGCPPCHEFDFTKWRCSYLCTKKARCDTYKNTCVCTKCKAMSGYDKFWNCNPPKALRSICNDGYRGKYNKGHFGCRGKDCYFGRKNGGYNGGKDFNFGKKNGGYFPGGIYFGGDKY